MGVQQRMSASPAASARRALFGLERWQYLGSRLLRLASLLLLLTGVIPFAAAQDGDSLTIVAVLDGDSIRLRQRNGERFELRLAAIDAPERAQAFGDRSRRHLMALLHDCALQLMTSKRDRFDRHVGTLTCIAKKGATFDVGLAQIAAGMAWHFSRYASEQPLSQRRAYADSQQLARQRRVGLWADTAPLAPWQYRQAQSVRSTSGKNIRAPRYRAMP